MPKGKKITPEVEALIALTYRKHPKWKAPEIRNEVEAILREKNPDTDRGWPGLSIVQKVLAIARKNESDESITGDDRPWSIGTLDKYPLSSTEIPIVLDVWKYREEQINILKHEGFEVPEYNARTLTIREAKWAARLSQVFVSGTNKSIRDLSQFASIYAEMEVSNLLAGNMDIFNTYSTDAFIAGLEYPYHKDEKHIQEQYDEAVKPEVKQQTKKRRKTNEK